mgnify:CR=1 FL=1
MMDDGTAAIFFQQRLAGTRARLSQRVLVRFLRQRYFLLIKSHCETRLANKKAAMRELNGSLAGPS